MTPPPLPEPPADYEQLVRFPSRRKGSLPKLAYRVHQAVNEPEWFSTAKYRFDPQTGPAPLFGPCYCADSRATAVMEAVGDLPVVTEAMLDR